MFSRGKHETSVRPLLIHSLKFQTVSPFAKRWRSPVFRELYCVSERLRGSQSSKFPYLYLFNWKGGLLNQLFLFRNKSIQFGS